MSRLEEREHLKELLLTVSGFDDGLALTLGGITGRLYSRLEELERVIEQDSRQAVIESLYADNQVYKQALEEVFNYALSFSHIEDLDENNPELFEFAWNVSDTVEQALKGDTNDRRTSI